MPTAPSAPEITAPSPSPATSDPLQFVSMSVSNGVRGANGGWQYTVTVELRETRGVAVTVTDIQLKARTGSTSLATTSVAPMLSMSAYSSKDAELVFATASQVDVSALTVDMTVQFRDANGNTGSVTSSNTCFGCWDY